MKQPTKSELITEVAQLKVIVHKLEGDDEKLRTEFSKALDAPFSYENEYGYARSKGVRTTYTWFEIFREVGKLLEKKKYTNLEDALTHHTMQINEIHERLAQLDGPDVPPNRSPR